MKTELRILKTSEVFWLGLAIKATLLFFFGSTFLRDLFIPFIDWAVTHPLQNPWSQYPPEYYPYGIALFLLQFIPKYLGYLVFGDLALGQTALSLALMKIPFLLLDFGLLITLMRISRESIRAILSYYWLNPVLIFITYIHGQTDGAAMMFAVVSIFLLIQGRIVPSALLFAMATLSKFHVVIILPLMMVYIWKNHFIQESLSKISKWGVTWAAVTVLGFLPNLLSGNFLHATVSSPQAGRVFGIQVTMSQGETFMIGFALLLLILGRLCFSLRVTNHGIIYGSGILYGMLLLITQPMPGWFFWVIPFLALFYATYYTSHPILFWGLIASHVAYFMIPELSGFTYSPLVSSFIFTVMQTFLIANLAEVWVLVIQTEMPLMESFRSRLIGISGDSGVGKSVLCQSLKHMFGPKNSLILEGDNYHLWERGHEKWDFYTHLNPKANQLPTLSKHTTDLKQGRFVMQSQYDHKSGKFTSPMKFKPKKFIIAQGLHTFYLTGMRNQFDHKIFIDLDERIRLSWKLKRDVEERGYPTDKVLSSIEERKGDYAKHIEPQKELADLIIEVFPNEEVTMDEIMNGKRPQFGVRYVVWNNLPLWNFRDALEKIDNIKAQIESVTGTIDRTSLKITELPSKETIQALSEELFPNVRHLTRNRREPEWNDGLSGLNQLMVLLLIQDKGVKPLA